jgi:calcineurin-like phosphoesterase family protein
MAVFVTSDTHFSHENIIKYTNRPYKDANHMNEDMIKKWNSAISKKDKVFHLGDFSLRKPEDCGSIIERLNGKIILVGGNHDVKSAERWINAGIAEVYNYPILYDGFYLMSHAPIFMNENTPFVNLFGHVHDHPSYMTWSSTGVCVCVERHDYTPINFEVIKEYYKSLSR